MPVYSLRMPEQCQPTSQNIEKAAIRAAIADKRNAA
jgi:AMMECR1 domain-containing protein